MSPEIIDQLNELLEAERSGMETAVRLASAEWKSCTRKDLRKFAEDEGWACTGLRRAIMRYGGLPSEKTGDFAQKVMALQNERAWLKLLAQGQRWVVKRIGRLPAKQLDPQTRAFLGEMQELHLQNMRWCNLRAEELEAPPSGPYRGLLYAHLREAHDRLYYGPWRGLSASVRDLQRAYHQLGGYLETLERGVANAGSAEAKTYLEKAQGAHLRADPRSYPDTAMLNLYYALAYAQHSLNCLLRREGVPNHHPEAFQSFYNVASVPFREEI